MAWMEYRKCTASKRILKIFFVHPSGNQGDTVGVEKVF